MFKYFLKASEKMIYIIYRKIYIKSPKTALIFKYNFIIRILLFLKPKRYKYLDVVFSDSEVRSELKLPRIKTSRIELYKNFNSKKKLARFSRIIAIGPASEYNKILREISDKYDAVVLNKIYPNFEKYKIPHIYILNNSWSKKNIDLIKEVYLKQEKSIICTPFKTEYSYDYFPILKSYTDKPFGISPMGLQRILLSLPHIVDHEFLKIVGYNLSLSSNPYSTKYPSLIKANWGSERKGIFFSNMRHCFVFNFALTRRIIQDYPFKIEYNSLKGLIDKHFKYSLRKFISIYS